MGSSGSSDQLGPIPFLSYDHGNELPRSIRTCIVILGFVLGKALCPEISIFVMPLCTDRKGLRNISDRRFGIIRHCKVWSESPML